MLLACQFVPFVKFVFETKILKFDNLSSYSDGVFLSQRVYNWCLGIFSCSVIISTVLTTVAVLVWMKII